MRIAIGQLWQETNTFNPLPTTRADFESFGVCGGPQLVEQMADVNELGGFIQSMRRWSEVPELAGLVRLPAWPGGRATPETFDWLSGTMLSALESVLPVDAVLLALHGALAAERHPDVEGEVLAAIRARVGPQVPIVATLDLHANLTRRMVASADALVLYHSMPHVDIFETGQRGAEVLRRILFEGARPRTAFLKIPAVVPAERSSTEAERGAAVEMKALVQKWERHPAVLAAGLAPVQPWLDVPEFGSAALVVTDDDPSLAESACVEIAQGFWDRRRDYLPHLIDVEDAVRLAFEQWTGLVVLSDAADATTSGAPGDSAWILAELLKYSWPRPALVTLVDPGLVERLAGAAAGERVRCQLGGLRDKRFGCRLAFSGEVLRRFDGRFTMTGHIGRNMPIDMGPGIVLCEPERNVRVVVTSRSGPHFAPELFRTAGEDPMGASVVVAKSPCGFRAVYQRRAAAIHSVRAPGCAPADFWNYEYAQIPRPLWPWDEACPWEPGDFAA